MDRGFLMAKQQLEAVARACPHSPGEFASVPGVRGWQIEAAGEALLDALAG